MLAFDVSNLFGVVILVILGLQNFSGDNFLGNFLVKMIAFLGFRHRDELYDRLSVVGGSIYGIWCSIFDWTIYGISIWLIYSLNIVRTPLLIFLKVEGSKF